VAMWIKFSKFVVVRVSTSLIERD